MNKKEIAKYIEHLMLKPTMLKEEVLAECEKAKKLGYDSVCVYPKYVEFARQCLDDIEAKIKLCTVVGYPAGEATQEIKAMEAVFASDAKADEIEVVVSTSAMVAENYEYIDEEVKRVVDCCEAKVKAIIEISDVEDSKIVKACQTCMDAGVRTIELGTIYSHRKVTPELVKMVADMIAGVCELAVVTETKSIEEMYDMICAGATKIVTYNGEDLINDFVKNKSKK